MQLMSLQITQNSTERKCDLNHYTLKWLQYLFGFLGFFGQVILASYSAVYLKSPHCFDLWDMQP